MPGLTIPLETAGSPRASPTSNPNTPAQTRRTSSSASAPQQPQPQPHPPSTSSSPSQQSESPNRSSPPITSSPGPSHLAPTFTGSGTFYTPNFAADRPRFRHSQGQSQDEADTVAPGAPAPIDFDSNSDVLALQSTISILLMQQQRAAADMVKLKKAKEAALADTEGFVRDLAAGKVGDNTAKGATHSKAAQAQKKYADEEGESEEDSEDDDDRKGDAADVKPWQSLPMPQNVARMPPVNWDKYAVAGRSLDRLHEEQRTRPSPGTPAVFTPTGTYDPGTPGRAYQGSGASPVTPALGKEYLGPTAPYNPLVDKLDDKKQKPMKAPATPRR